MFKMEKMFYHTRDVEGLDEETLLERTDINRELRFEFVPVKVVVVHRGPDRKQYVYYTRVGYKQIDYKRT